jgi:hypothetical protein
VIRFALVALVAAGCSGISPPETMCCHREQAAACVGLAFATLAKNAPAPQPPASKCCGECGKNGLPHGKVRSGDGLAIVNCDCPPDCPGFKAASKAASKPAAMPANCPTGTCPKR